MTHLAHPILPAQQPLETAPFPSFCPTLPHPDSRSGGRGCNLLGLQVSTQHSVLTLPFRPDWNRFILQFWPHPLLQHSVNSPFKLSFYAIFFLKLPLIFPHTTCLKTMSRRNVNPFLGWPKQRKAAGNTCWAGIPLLSPLGAEPSLGLCTGLAKHFAAMSIIDLPIQFFPLFFAHALLQLSWWHIASSVVPAQLSLKCMPQARPRNCF